MEANKLILKEINQRMNDIERSLIFSYLILLVQRFKKLHLEDPMVCANTVQRIKDMMKKDFPEEKHTESESDSSDITAEDFSF